MDSASSSKAARRLRRLAESVLCLPANVAGDAGGCQPQFHSLAELHPLRLEQIAVAGPSSILEHEGAAIGRLSSVHVVLLNSSARGVPLGTESEVQAIFARHGLAALRASSLEEIPADTDVLVTMGATVDREVLDRAPKLRLVAVAFTGTDHIDVSACKARHVDVVHVPGYSTDATAELAIGMVLEHLRKLPECHQVIEDGHWACPPQEDLRSKNVGIIGLGKIGLRLAELFRAFRVQNLLGYSLGKPPEFAALGGHFADSLAELFLDSDIVVVCVPLDASTEGLISDKLMELLRPGSLLVNISRGSVVDESALVKHLGRRRFRAALDVFSIEPLPPDSPLRSVPQDVLSMTPHIGYQSEASLAKRLDVTVKNILAYLAGQPINRVVS